ncbi:hypothetical protein [Actinoplanes sp. M2I2]|uniref:hypothetical protein n=1 Tax=Actinoplanes sp. M2I2 TaxID=1734444 RepID=UPI002021D709|nr:hypothetical protein [Actinoplanes sp. M2I2]
MSPHNRDTSPAAIPGGFSPEQPSAAGAPPTRSPEWDDDTLFVAPPTTDEKQSASHVSDSGEVAMDKLRHPFDVTAPHPEK